MAAVLDHLGVLYTTQGKYKQADAHHRQALEIRRKTLGAGHLLVAQSLEHYAVLMIDTGRDVEARRAQTLAASIRERNAKANEPKPAESGSPQKRAVHMLKTTN